jgi:hypothetical protein
MAAGAWVVYNEAKLALGKKLMNLSATDSIKMALFLSTSNAGSAALATAQYATLTNQVAGSYGYTAGGVACAQTFSNAAGTETFDVADASWTASGGSITARFAVLYDDTAANKDLIAYCLLDSAPADVTVTDGNTLSIQINPLGVFTIA